nr:MAG TPA: hypothetical protein [Caudoviricetes sp.]
MLLSFVIYLVLPIFINYITSIFFIQYLPIILLYLFF